MYNEKTGTFTGDPNGVQIDVSNPPTGGSGVTKAPLEAATIRLAKSMTAVLDQIKKIIELTE